MSKAHMQPMARPRTTAPEADRPLRKSIMAVLMAAMGPEMPSMTRPTIAVENSGYRKIALRPSRFLGRPAKTFSSSRMT